MEKQPHNYCVILAGGKGRRLWPSSRQGCPKQFIDFFGTGQTQLQSTFERFARFIPKENIFVTTTKDYAPLVRRQLPGIDESRILQEPVNRNTSPTVAWAGYRIHRECADARIIITPSDQLVIGDSVFEKDVLHALDFVGSNPLMLTMGIRPSRPEPGYGYIQIGEPTVAWGIHKVQSFTEKPNREFAQMFMDSGEFLWNTGMFLANVSFLRQWCIKNLPDLPHRLADLSLDATLEREEEFVRQYFSAYPNLSMDQAALEKSDEVYVMRCDFGWADIGTWHSIYEFMQRADEDNVVIDSEVVIEDSRDNIIKLPKGHVGVINGLEGYIVAEEGDVLLICKKGDSSALIRKYVNEVGLKYGEAYI